MKIDKKRVHFTSTKFNFDFFSKKGNSLSYYYIGRESACTYVCAVVWFMYGPVHNDSTERIFAV